MAVLFVGAWFAAFLSGACAALSLRNALESIFDWRPMAVAAVCGVSMSGLFVWMAVRP
jgi:hypothetical protein